MSYTANLLCYNYSQHIGPIFKVKLQPCQKVLKNETKSKKTMLPSSFSRGKFVILLITFLVFLNYLFVSAESKPTAFISGCSVILASISLAYTDESFQRTENTIRKAEKDAEIRNIEESLKYFYYPMREYFIDYISGKDNLSPSDQALQHQIWSQIAYCRFLATDRTKSQFEKAFSTSHSQDEIEIKKNEVDTLSGYIDKDIEKLENRIKELKSLI